MKRLIPPALLVAALLFAGCAVNPATGKREFSLVSQSQEKQMGEEAHPAILAEYGVYDDPVITAKVDSMGQALARRSELPDLEWHFTVLDDPTVNAFALPGGYIYITRGIMAHLNSDAQLAGVIGHEIGHVTARHSAQRMTYQQLAGLGLGIAAIASPEFARYGALAEQGLGLMLLKYGRDDENQADELGIRYSLAAGYDPRQMPATYQMLARTATLSGGDRLPSWLSTHPDPGDREQRTRTLAAEAVAGRTGLIVNSRSYVQSLDGISFGQDPREGYFIHDVFYHPDLDFQITMPEGWKRQNTKAALVAVEPNEQAVIQLSVGNLGDFTPSQYVVELQRRGNISGAEGSATNLGGYDAWVGVVAAESGRLEATFIRMSPDLSLQILGKAASSALEQTVLRSMRSFQKLQDRARLNAEPDRVNIVYATSSTSFQEAISRFPDQALELDATAVLNNAYPDQPVQRNEALKIVERGRRR